MSIFDLIVFYESRTIILGVSSTLIKNIYLTSQFQDNDTSKSVRANSADHQNIRKF